jgi:periplasmic divalent cation tolerance protein
MSEALIVFCTCGSEDEAERIANALVNERLAACVNILPPVESIYRWQGAVERAREILLVIKTTAGRFSALRDRIEAIHSYDTPEIIAMEVAEGSERYLAWLGEQCASEVH